MIAIDLLLTFDVFSSPELAEEDNYISEQNRQRYREPSIDYDNQPRMVQIENPSVISSQV